MEDYMIQILTSDKRSRIDIILDRIREQNAENMA